MITLSPSLSQVHSSYNPVLITVSGTEGEALALLYVVLSGYTEAEYASVRVDLSNGRTQIDLQGTLKVLFNKQLDNLSKANVIVDTAQSFKYEIREGSITSNILLQGTAVCSVAQIRESHDVRTDEILTAFTTIKVYPEYPRDLSIIPSTSSLHKGDPTTPLVVNRLRLECDDNPSEGTKILGSWDEFICQEDKDIILTLGGEGAEVQESWVEGWAEGWQSPITSRYIPSSRKILCKAISNNPLYKVSLSPPIQEDYHCIVNFPPNTTGQDIVVEITFTQQVEGGKTIVLHLIHEK